MRADSRFLEEYFAQDDAQGLQRALERWESPDPGVLLGLLDKSEERPYTTACLLHYLHSHFTAEEIEAGRRLRQEKQLGDLAWETEDWEEYFRWEDTSEGCRILEYLGGDPEVLIPEFLGDRPVYEIAQRFFFQTAEISRILVPEGIRVGGILPHEAAELFGKEPATPEIVWLEREQPLPDFEQPVCSLPCGKYVPGELVQFGRYSHGQNGSVQPIIWVVLHREAERALLAASCVLELLPYHHNRSAVVWAGCDLRNWLNDSFIRAAFTEEEQALLVPMSLAGEANPVFRTRNNSRSLDRVFLLDPSEWDSYKNFLDNSTIKTPWAARDDVTHDAVGICPVWMRMPGLNTQYAVVLDTAMQPDYQGRLVNEQTIGVCPAIWIRV